MIVHTHGLTFFMAFPPVKAPLIFFITSRISSCLSLSAAGEKQLFFIIKNHFVNVGYYST